MIDPFNPEPPKVASPPSLRFRLLPLPVVSRWSPLAHELGVCKTERGREGFVPAFHRSGGDASRISERWLMKRDIFIKKHLAIFEETGEEMWDELGRPSRRHLALVMWAYSPVSGELKRRHEDG